MKKIIGIVLFIISAIPLITYPAVIFADFMLLATTNFNWVKILPKIVAYLFLITNITYGITYIISLVFFIRKRGTSILIAIVPYIHLLIVFLLYII